MKLIKAAVQRPVVLIPLGGRHANGRQAIVDTDLPHLQALLACRWYATEKGYAKTFDWQDGLGGRVVAKLHQVVMGTARRQVVDHINRNPLDNRRSNLRPASASQNAMNREQPRGEVAYRGVSPRGRTFHAKLRWHGESLHLGDFDTAKDAARVYDLFALLIAGDFARTNSNAARYEGLIKQLRRYIAAEAEVDL